MEKRQIRNVAVVFTAGAIGGFITAVVATIFTASGIVAATGSGLELPTHSIWFVDPPTNYRLIVWGGLFGLLFLFPFVKNMVWWHWGIVVSLAAGISPLVIVFPLKFGSAMFLGLALGWPTIPWVLFFNFFYGIPTAYIIHRVGLER